MTTADLRLVHPPPPAAPRDEAFRYRAFISYSHRDAPAAAALQRALETYRLPRRLVGRATAQGNVPQHLKPVFRDRDELPAGTDLKAVVREAIASTRWLIVMCSPSAAASPWVNREIVEFKKHHGESHVLAVIVAGEPFASRLPGREGEECFPTALRFALNADGESQGEPLEPIAVDLRPQGDGKRLALLKLVAGMTGVGVDELARRDAQRRAQRLAWVALGASVGMVVMAVLSVMALQARNEAQHQRAQAEDLIEFMLGDLRKKLEPVGRLDVLDAVGEKALAHYAAQRADALDANELGRRSRALHMIGEIREKRGNLDEALKAFQSAADTTEKLLARAPNDGQRIFDHAQSVYWVGYIAWLRRQAPEAEAAWRSYLDLAQRLPKLDPANVDWRIETAYATRNLGALYLESGRPAEALQSFSQARDVYLAVVGRRPDLNFELANEYGWIAKAQERLGDFAAAVEAQRAKIAVLKQVPDAGKNRQVQRLVANGEFEIGRLQLALGQPLLALASARAAVQSLEALSVVDPSNLMWLRNLSMARLALAEIQGALHGRDAARALVERVAMDVRRLRQADSKQRARQVILNGVLLKLQARFALADRREFPSQPLREYLADVDSLVAGAVALDPEQVTIASDVQLALGDLLARASEREAAMSNWRALALRVQSLAQAKNLAAMTILARSDLRSGRLDEARALAAQIQASTYRHPDYADLVNELAHGTGPWQLKSTKRR